MVCCTKTFSLALPVCGLLAAFGVMAMETSLSTRSSTTPAQGLFVAGSQSDVSIPAVSTAASDAPTVVNMSNWQETRRRGSVRQL